MTDRWTWVDTVGVAHRHATIGGAGGGDGAGSSRPISTPNEPVELFRKDFQAMQTHILRVMQDHTLTQDQLREVQGQLNHMEQALMDKLEISFAQAPPRDSSFLTLGDSLTTLTISLGTLGHNTTLSASLGFDDRCRRGPSSTTKSSLLTLSDSLTALTISLGTLSLNTSLSASLGSGDRRRRGPSSTTKLTKGGVGTSLVASKAEEVKKVKEVLLLKSSSSPSSSSTTTTTTACGLRGFVVRYLGSSLVVQQLSVIALHYCELLHFKAKLQRRRQELTQTTPDQPVDDGVVYYKVADISRKAGRVSCRIVKTQK
ncbi:hypothetical protein Scep_003747 [Stephania cephalantha]|uniref:Uncharacterized protein n=1 Tax=Stephania cephalantha TaxID=152367 RepID=A0AAP0KSL0_9MAGN